MNPVLGYHQQTKHHFNRFARSLGYLDWAAQPDPFRRYHGAPTLDLPRTALRGAIPYAALFDGSAPPAPFDLASIGEFLRCSMGLSAWKQYQANRWSLRVNPSSGNLHPTECYIAWNGRVCHYAPRDHLLEVRAEWSTSPAGTEADYVVVGLSSIAWREAWKYGERGFRYCQHDVGHAIGALRCAAALLGWRLVLLTRCSDAQVARVLGLDRAADFDGAEPEEPECLAVVSAGIRPATVDVAALADAAAGATWSGRANVLSRSHVDWPAIDDVAERTRKRDVTAAPPAPARSLASAVRRTDRAPAIAPGESGSALVPAARTIILQRRSAVAFDARSTLPRRTLIAMLRRLVPPGPPWDAIDWPPHVHLAIFVHRVDGLTPGVYVFIRAAAALDDLRAALRPEFLWEPMNENDGDRSNGLFLLVPSDVRFAANRLSCDQDIAADGFFSLGMIARVEPALEERGDWFYRRLFWECGLIGQVLYLEAEAAGARSTGIGCFYDDAVHEVLGLTRMTWQSLYHFSMGTPVDDGRLTQDPGYPGGW